MYEHTDTPAMPFDYSDWQLLTSSISKMESKFSFSANEWQVFNVTQWAMDSFDLTKFTVYSGIKENTEPSTDYVSKNEYLLER